jgi:Uma2 family endonuclease
MVIVEEATEVRPWGDAFYRGDLEGMPADGHRYEIIDGTLIVSAAPGRMHQRAVKRMTRVLDDACPSAYEVVVAPFAVGLDENTEVQPDVLVGRREDFTERDLPTAPLLAVEVLSPSSRLIDTHVKRERMERAGARAYWVVEPSARPDEAYLVVWELGDDKRFHEAARVTGREAFTATVPFPVTVIPAALVID